MGQTAYSFYITNQVRLLTAVPHHQSLTVNAERPFPPHHLAKFDERGQNGRYSPKIKE